MWRVKHIREYILTSNEREIIKSYMEKNQRLEGFAMLLSRCRNMQTIMDDLELIEQFLAKNGEKTQ